MNENEKRMQPESGTYDEDAGLFPDFSAEELDRIAHDILDDIVVNRRISLGELLDDPNAVTDHIDKAVGDYFSGAKKQ
ncbi:MAG: hypothetical protein IK093_05330 [Ruminiclostridium sp.]|nr:hypothetical protein [Ruminiclostridium sp.]